MNLHITHHIANETERLMVAERDKMLQYACYRLGSLDEAEDAVQDAFVNVHKRLGEDDADIRNLSAYLYCALANICVSRLREAERTPIVPLDSVPEPIASEDDDFEQEFHRINHLLTEIPDMQAEVIRLRFYGDRSFQEIADILGIPLNTAKSRFTYGMEKIKRGMLALYS